MSIILYQYDNLVNGAKLVKRPSKHIKSPYIADILVNENETLAHYLNIRSIGFIKL